MKSDNGEIVIKVIGVGGAGIVMTNAMIKNGIKNAQFYAVDADVRALRSSIATEKVQIGANLTRGLGAGSDLGYGYKCAIEDQDKLLQIAENADLVYIVTGLGGGIGTGASPVIAELAKKAKAITVVVATKPFDFEGIIRLDQFEKGAKELEKRADLLVIIPNQRLIENISPRTSVINAFKMADDMVSQILMSIYDIFINDINKNSSAVDFDDVKKLLTGKGQALIGVGEESGEKRASKASQKSISDLRLEDDQLQKADLALINIIGASNMQMSEIDEAINSIRNMLNPEADIIWAVTLKEELAEKIRVFLMITGFNI